MVAGSPPSCRASQVTNNVAVTSVRRAVLQQIMIEWKLLAEEEKIQRQMQMQLAEDYDEHSILDDVDAIDKLAQELSTDNHNNLLRRVNQGQGQGSPMMPAHSAKGGDAEGREDPSDKPPAGRGADEHEKEESRVFHRTIGGLDSRDPSAYLFQVLCRWAGGRHWILHGFWLLQGSQAALVLQVDGAAHVRARVRAWEWEWALCSRRDLVQGYARIRECRNAVWAVLLMLGCRLSDEP